MGYYNCLKSFNYPITNTDSKFFWIKLNKSFFKRYLNK
jgi:hypothetical protein